MNSRIIFFSLAIALVIGIALFTTKIFTTGLRIAHPLSRSLILGSLAVPLLFIASMVGSRSVTWGIGPITYTIINTIAGVFFYLFMGALLLGIVLAIAALIGKEVPIIVSYVFFFVSLSMGILGIIQAKIITTKNYTVTLPNAPASWNEKRAVLVTDTHFGLVNHKNFSDKVINKILKINPDLVLHAGDFYDGPAIETASITESWKKLTTTIPVFYAPGNHELYGNYGEFIASIAGSGATVLDNKVVEYDGVQISGITYFDGKVSAEATTSIQNLAIDPSRASILINHPPTSLAAANDAGINLMVSGHTHNGQFWPTTYLVRHIYGIYYYGHKMYQSMQTITSSGVGTFGPPLRLFNSPELVIITFKTK